MTLNYVPCKAASSYILAIGVDFLIGGSFKIRLKFIVFYCLTFYQDAEVVLTFQNGKLC